MTDLTETQRTVLTAAAERPDFQILPLPDRIKGGAAKKVTTALLARGLIREGCDGATLVATDAGLRAIGIEPAPVEPIGQNHAEDAQPVRSIRPGTKQAKLVAMLEAPDGATIAEIAEATGWMQHTVRGAIAGALKKRLGLKVMSEKLVGRGRVYRLRR